MAAYNLNLTENASGDWQDDDDADLVYEVTLANLVNASHIRVDTRVTGRRMEEGHPDEIPEG